MYTRHIISIFNPILIFIFIFKCTLTSVKFFFSIFKTHLINFVQIVCIIIRVQKFWCFVICGTYFLCFIYYNFIHCIINDGVIFLLPINCFLSTGLLPWSLVCLLSVYLVPNSPRHLHSSEECTGPWMRQVFDFPAGLSTCRFLLLPALSPFLGRVHNEAYYPLFCLLLPEQLESARVGFL